MILSARTYGMALLSGAVLLSGCMPAYRAAPEQAQVTKQTASVLVAALEQWPAAGVPRNPGAWLMATAKRRAIDYFRSASLGDRRYLLFNPVTKSKVTFWFASSSCSMSQSSSRG